MTNLLIDFNGMSNRLGLFNDENCVHSVFIFISFVWLYFRRDFVQVLSNMKDLKHIHLTLTFRTSLGQSEPGYIGNGGVLHTLHISRIGA